MPRLSAHQALVDMTYRAILDYMSRHPPFDGFTFGSPTWRDYMWFKAGLLKVAEDARASFLASYAEQVLQSIGMWLVEQDSRIQNLSYHFMPPLLLHYL